jgi:hypothetical protein
MHRGVGVCSVQGLGGALGIDDRAFGPQEASAFDHGQKCADVMSLTAVANHFQA